MNTQSYVSGNLALSVIPEQKNKLIVINGGRNSCRADADTTACSPRSVHSRRLSAIRACFIIIVGALVFLASYQISAAASAPTYDLIDNMSLQSVRVRQGATLWDLAETYNVDGVSTQDMVSAIKDWNDLDSSMLQPGQTIFVADPS